MKKIFIFLIFSSILYSYSINNADKLFDKYMFQEALNEYDNIIRTTKNKTIKYRAFHRACECLIELGKYGEAAQRVIDFEIPKEIKQKARFLILKSQILQTFLNKHYWVLRELDTENQEKSIYELTYQDIKKIINDCYLSLWNIKHSIINIPIKEEAYYFDIKNTDFGMYPTLYDFFIFLWTNYLLQDEKKVINFYAEIILKDELDEKIDNSSVLLACKLMEEASSIKKTNREEASERWKIERLLLPLKYKYFKFKDKTKYKFAAADILISWYNKFSTKVARAQAAYEACKILYELERYKQTVELCRKIEIEFPETIFAKEANNLRQNIELPKFINIITQSALAPGKTSIILETKNIQKVYLRIYKTNPILLKNNYLNNESENNYEGQQWTYFLNNINKDVVKYFLKKERPIKELIYNTNETGEYKVIKNTLSLSELSNGFYTIIACENNSFNIDKCLVSACFLNVSDLILVATSGFSKNAENAYFDYISNRYTKQEKKFSDSPVRYYTFNGLSGELEPNVEIIKLRDSIFTNGKGFATEISDFYTMVGQYNNFSTDFLATKGNNYAYLNNPVYVSYFFKNPIEIFLETDKPIYRPGQKIFLKAIGLFRTRDGYRTIEKDNNIIITALDRNNKEFFKKEIKTNEFGSVSTEIEIPNNLLLGIYKIKAAINFNRFNKEETINITVEEYKRPDFEIIFDKTDSIWIYGKPVKISGFVKYYFGTPVQKAALRYNIKKQPFLPSVYEDFLIRSYYSNYNKVTQAEEGDLLTDENGKFEIEFTPKEENEYTLNIFWPKISNYTVDIEARDASGRTIMNFENYKCSKTGYYYIIETSKGFFYENEPSEFNIKLLSINDIPTSGKSDYKVYLLGEKENKTQLQQENNYFQPTLESQLSDAKNLELISYGEIVHNNDGIAKLSLKNLKTGAYRLIINLKDNDKELSQEKVFIVAKNSYEGIPIDIDSILCSRKDEYKVGEKAQFIIGSSKCKGVYYIEIYSGNTFIRNELIEDKLPIRIIDIPITNELKGGFKIIWFAVSDMNVYYAQKEISVPWEEKKLNISISNLKKEFKPKEKVNTIISVKDNFNKPASCEILALMYDRSLEYYFKSNNRWLDDLYLQKNNFYRYIDDSIFDVYSSQIYEKKYNFWDNIIFPQQQFIELQPPSLRSIRYYGKRNFRFSLKSVSTAQEISEDKISQPQQEVRKDFKDSVFFTPHIKTNKEGIAKLDFTMPDQLSSFKIKLFSFTKDAKECAFTEDINTKKELMLRLDLPRYFREKDKATLTVFIHNETTNNISGKLFTDIYENNKKVNEKFNFQKTILNFSVEKKSAQHFNFPIDVPQGVTKYTIISSAISDNLSDAEQRIIPVLPSRQRLIQSSFQTLSNNDKKTIEISLNDDPTRISELVNLRIEPQLAVSLLNTIPFLIDYPHECIEQILNKFIPISIINAIYKNFPEIQQSLKKLPKRNTIVSEWQKEDPLRLITLAETPWVWQSEGMPTDRELIDLLNSELVEKLTNDYLKKIQEMQLSDGSFPWWHSGRPDIYMTLYVLSGFAEAKKYGVKIPTHLVNNALKYINKNITKYLNLNEYDLSVVSFAIYVLTSFSQEEFTEAKNSLNIVKKCIEHLEINFAKLNPLSKCYLAYVYSALGNKTKSNEVLDAALDGFIEDPIIGIHWTPEKYSWLWYSDTIEKHAFLLRTLQLLRPDDKRIEGMVKWLMFNRKGNVWKSTKASAAAVYALIEYLKKSGALSSEQIFDIDFGEIKDTVTLKPYDFLENPLTWQKKILKTSNNSQKAVISKNGAGLAFASLTWIYSTDEMPKESTTELLSLKRTYYKKTRNKGNYYLKPIKSTDIVSVGDEVLVEIKINSKSQFEYMHLKDPKASGFESDTLLSNWKYKNLSYYEEIRDTLTNFFIPWIPHGEYKLTYILRPTKPGKYKVHSAIIQSMYAPEIAAYSDSFTFNVE